MVQSQSRISKSKSIKSHTSNQTTKVQKEVILRKGPFPGLTRVGSICRNTSVKGQYQCHLLSQRPNSNQILWVNAKSVAAVAKSVAPDWSGPISPLKRGYKTVIRRNMAKRFPAAIVSPMDGDHGGYLSHSIAHRQALVRHPSVKASIHTDYRIWMR